MSAAEVEQQHELVQRLRSVVARDEDEVKRQQQRIRTVADEVQQQLDETLPSLKDSLKMIATVNKSDLMEVKMLVRPPHTTMLVLAGTCVLHGVAPDSKADPGLQEYTDTAELPSSTARYWRPGKAWLNTSTFWDHMKAFQHDNISAETMHKLQPSTTHPLFARQRVVRCDLLTRSLFRWILAMEQYYLCSQRVEPLRHQMRAMSESLDTTLRGLQEAKQLLRDAGA